MSDTRELVREYWEVHCECELESGEWYLDICNPQMREEALATLHRRRASPPYRNVRLIHVRRYRKVKPEMTPMEAGRRFASCFGGSHRGAAFQALADSAGTPASGILAADQEIRRAVKSGKELADEYGFKPLSQAEHALAISKLVKGAP